MQAVGGYKGRRTVKQNYAWRNKKELDKGGLKYGLYI